MNAASCGDWPRLPLSPIGRQEGAGAQVEQFAIAAIGIAGRATSAAMPDQPVTEQGPDLAGEDQHQLQFNFLGLLLAGETQALRKARDVGVNDNAVGDVKRVAENDICRLSSHAIQFNQGFHGTRHLAMVVLHECLAAALDMPCLATEETKTPNFLLE